MSLPSKTAQPVLLVTAAIALGCTNEVSDVVNTDTSSSHALLVLEQSASLDEAVAARSDASVWFLRLASENDLDAATQLFTERRELPPIGTCVTVRTNNPRIPADMSPVELEFAGDVRIRAGDVALPLTVRFFPGVANLVSGAMYTLRGQDDLEVPFEGTLTISAEGTPDFEPLMASAAPPSMPGGLALDGQPLQTTEAKVQRGRNLYLTWIPVGNADAVYVDLDPVPADPAERVRCTLADTGMATIPTMAVPETSVMNISLHRSRDVDLRSERRNVGIAHFDMSVSKRVRIDP